MIEEKEIKMIIEIKGLPNGQAIKHINVDITFDETGPVVRSTVDTSENQKHSFTPKPQPQQTNPAQTAVDSSIDSSLIVERPNIEEQRERKEVPAEMTDLEF